ncbi:MAG: sulfatase [Rhodospirillaceae bacterium]|nr:sulfatase [Rhodospirillaceae bacterium]MDD9999138.1 sulfatase [Rhodospirillaceae bacterium]MDE0362501.1 sulfatase [Rhodospirillaceae bacterium]
MNSSSSITRIVIAATLLAAAPFAPGQDSSTPNIILIVADDQGWNHLSVPMNDELPGSGSDYFRTPNIERIAAAGMRFPNAYAAAPMCGPSRIALHYGKSTAQVVYSEAAEDVRAESVTIGEMMQSAGYATAHFGKWSPGAPESGLQHYDENDGNAGNGNGNVDNPANPKDIFGITERAIAFMETSVAAGQPFYMQLSHYAPHVGFQALVVTLEKWDSIAPGAIHTDPVYAAMTEDLDTGIGRVLDKLQDLGVDNNTYVIYTSDHGQTINRSTNQPLRLGKGTLWEGGMRVPFIVSGPGIPGGTVSDARVVSLDFFPTFAELAGVTESLPDDLDGGSLVPLLQRGGEGDVRRAREELVFHFAQPSGQPESRPSSSIYLENYKLLKFYDTGDLQLFDIAADLRERQDLAGRMPERVEALHLRLMSYLDAVGATIPDPSTMTPGTAPGAGMGMGAGAMGMGGEQ